MIFNIPVYEKFDRKDHNIQRILCLRSLARQQKDWKFADYLRKYLAYLGYIVIDLADGTSTLEYANKYRLSWLEYQNNYIDYKNHSISPNKLNIWICSNCHFALYYLPMIGHICEHCGQKNSYMPR